MATCCVCRSDLSSGLAKKLHGLAFKGVMNLDDINFTCTRKIGLVSVYIYMCVCVQFFFCNLVN